MATQTANCGGGLTATWNDAVSGPLTITYDGSGTGVMINYTSTSYGRIPPWYSSRTLLTSLSLPNGITHIGNFAFNYCSGFTGSLTIPNSVTSIGNYAFHGCSGFTGSLVIPNSVTSIGNYAFRGCSGFTGSLTIPNSVTSIGSYAFENCGGTNFIVASDNPNYSSENGFLMNKDKTTLIQALIGRTDNDVVIPSTTTSIGNYAFHGCSGFTGSLTIPNSVTSIGSSAFEGCSGFTGSLTIPNSVTSIGSYAFEGCSGFTDVKFMGNQPTLGSSAFILNESSPAKTYDVYSNGWANTTTFPEFTYTKWIYHTYTISGGVAYYKDTTNKKLIIMPATTPESGCTPGQMKDYTSTGGPWGIITESGWSLEIQSGVTNIGNYAFYKCTGFTSTLTIPSGITSIGTQAFRNCWNMTGSLTIPDTVTTISDGAFQNCWGFTGALDIPNSVTSIGSSGIRNCYGLTSLTIPDSITLLSSNVFLDCAGLTSVTIPNSVTNIGYRAFCNCTGLTSVTLPNALTAIGGEAFCNCPSISGTLTIPETVATIDASAFKGCKAIDGVIFLGNQPTLGASAFELNTATPSVTCDIQSNGWANTTTFPEYDYTKWNYIYVGNKIYVKVGGAWKEGTIYVNVGGVWKKGDPKVKVGGEWK